MDHPADDDRSRRNPPGSRDNHSLADDDYFIRQLAEFDDALLQGSLAGASRTLDLQVSTEDTERFHSLREFLALLHQVARGSTRSKLPATVVDADSISPVALSLSKLGRFEIVRELGHGSQGVVFLAYDPVLKRRLALKAPRWGAITEPEQRRRFLREAEIVARLTHPNIVAVHEVDQDGPIWFIASDYCEGPTLAQWLRAAPTPPEPRDASKLIATLARALYYAHERGIIHRDVKPGNVLLEAGVDSRQLTVDRRARQGTGNREQGTVAKDKGLDSRLRGNDETPLTPAQRTSNNDQRVSTTDQLSRYTPKLMDFGLARFAEADGEATRTGAILGTPAYMSPEQVDGRQAEIGPATDVYGLGAVLYELLTGKPPVKGGSDADTFRRIVYDDPSPPSRFRREVPRDLDAICLKCLEKKPTQRYSSADELADDLDRFLQGTPIRARSISSLERLVRWTKRRPVSAALIFFLSLAGIGIPVGLLYHARQLNAALRETERERTSAVRHRQEALDRAYAADIRLGFQFLAQGNPKALDRVLARYDHALSSSEPPPFEYAYLSRFRDPMPAGARLHRQRVRFVALNSEANIGVSADQNGTLLGWDAETYAIRWRRQIANAGACADRDCRVVFAVDRGNQVIQKLDPVTGGEIRRFELDIPINRIATTTDGKMLAVSRDDHRELSIVDATAGKVIRVLRPLADRTTIVTMRFSPDGKYLAAAVGESGKSISVWDVASGTELSHWDGDAPIRDVFFDPNAESLYQISENRAALIHEPNSLGVKGEISFLGVRPDGPNAWVQHCLYVAQGTSVIAPISPLRDGELAPLTWQGAEISTLAASSDNQSFIVGTEDGAVHVVRPPSASLYDAIDWPADSPVMAISNSGLELAISTPDGAVTRLDLATGHALVSPRIHTARITSLAYSSDDRRIASADRGGVVTVWQDNRVLCRGKPLGMGYGDTPHTAVFANHPGQIVVTGVNENTIAIWDYTVDETQTIDTGNVQCIAITNNSPIGCVLSDHTITAYDLQTRNSLWSQRAEAPVKAMGMSSDGKMLAVAEHHPDVQNQETLIRLFQAATGEAMPLTLSRMGGDALSLEFSKSGKVLISRFLSQAGSSLAVFNLTGNGTAIIGRNRFCTLTGQAIRADQQFFMVDGEGDLISMDVNKMETRRLPLSHGGVVHSIAFSPDSTTVAVAKEVPRIAVKRVVDVPLTKSDLIQLVATSAHLADGIRCYRLPGAFEATMIPYSICTISPDRLAWSPQEDLIVTGGLDGRLRFWSAENGELLAERFVSDRAKADSAKIDMLHRGFGMPEYDVDGEPVIAISFSKDGQTLLSGGLHGSLMIWNASTASEVRRLRRPAKDAKMNAAALSPDGGVAACAVGGLTTVYDTESGETLAELGATGGPAVLSAVFLPDSAQIAVGLIDGTIQIKTLRGSQPAIVLDGHVHAVTNLAVTSDGRLLASGGSDQVKLWSLSTMSELGNIAAPLSGKIGADVSALTFSPDDSILAVGFANGAVIVWDSKNQSTQSRSTSENLAVDAP